MITSALRGIEPADGRIVFADTEGTGLDRERKQVWEIAGIIRDPGLPDVEFEWQVRPNLRDSEPTGMRLNRYYHRCQLIDSMPGAARVIVHPGLDDGLDYAERIQLVDTTAAYVAGQVARMLAGAHLVGAVPDYDDGILYAFLRDHGQVATNHYHLMDIEGIAVGFAHGLLRAHDAIIEGMGLNRQDLAQIVRGVSWDSESLSRAVGVEPPPRETRHRALVDARWVRDVYDAITGYKQPTA